VFLEFLFEVTQVCDEKYLLSNYGARLLAFSIVLSFHVLKNMEIFVETQICKVQCLQV
jgi:hypothetical protein